MHLFQKTIIVDATHTTARFHSKSVTEYLQDKSKLLRKVVYSHDASMKETFPTKPITTDLDKEMAHNKELIDRIEADPTLNKLPAIKEKPNLVKEVMEDVSKK